MKASLPILATLLLVGLTACAKTGTLKTDASSSAIRSAEDLGAADVPSASLHLQLAKEELIAAEALHAKGEAEQANSMLLRAEADAELAIALSRADTEKVQAQEAMDRVRKLQAENPYARGGVN